MQYLILTLKETVQAAQLLLHLPLDHEDVLKALTLNHFQQTPQNREEGVLKAKGERLPKQAGEDAALCAHLWLVDLAGSERVGKTRSGSSVGRETCSINLSLHFLEQIIVALQARLFHHDVQAALLSKCPG